jgi:hypothetical protein
MVDKKRKATYSSIISFAAFIVLSIESIAMSYLVIVIPIKGMPKTNSEEPSFLQYYDSLARKNSTGERIEG